MGQVGIANKTRIQLQVNDQARAEKPPQPLSLFKPFKPLLPLVRGVRLGLNVASVVGSTAEREMPAGQSQGESSITSGAGSGSDLGSASASSTDGIAFGALGFTIATIETHKMFDHSHERGKFAGKPVRFPQIVDARRRYVPVFLALWAVMLLTLAAALSAPRAGLLASIDLTALRGP